MSTVSVLGLDRKGLNRVLFRQPGPEHCSGAVYLHSGWFTGNSLHIQVNQSITTVEATIRPIIFTWEFILYPHNYFFIQPPRPILFTVLESLNFSTLFLHSAAFRFNWASLNPKTAATSTMQCYGFEIFIPEPGSEFFHTWSRIPNPGSKKILDPESGSASKNLSIFNPKNCFCALGNRYDPDVHPWSGSWRFTHPGSRGLKGTGSRIRNTATVSQSL